MLGDIFFDETKAIENEFDGGLWWIKGDSGSWDGPSVDWLTHRTNILTPVKDFSVCVQAGGNLGLYPKMLSERFTRVYTFEPHPLSFRCMMKNIEDRRNIYPQNAALAEKNGLCSMTMEVSDNMGMNTTIFTNGGYVPTFTVDQLALDSCGLIWFDIEGAEAGAIEGSRFTIERYHPVIALETVSNWTSSFLLDKGYSNLGRSVSDSVFVYSG